MSVGPPPVPLHDSLSGSPPFEDSRPAGLALLSVGSPGGDRRSSRGSQGARTSVVQFSGQRAAPDASLEGKLAAQVARNGQLKKQIGQLQSESRALQTRCRALERRLLEMETANGVRVERDIERQKEREDEKQRWADEREHLEKRVRRLSDQAGKYPLLEKALVDLFHEFVSTDAVEEDSRKRQSQLAGVNPLCLVDYIRCGLRGMLQVSDDAAAELRRSLCRAERRAEQAQLEQHDAEERLAREREEAQMARDRAAGQDANAEDKLELRQSQQELAVAKEQIQELKRRVGRQDRELAGLRDGLEQRERALCEKEKIALRVPVLERAVEKARRARAREETGEELRLRQQLHAFDGKIRALRDRAVQADEAGERCRQLERQLKELRRAPIQRHLVEVVRERDRLAQGCDDQRRDAELARAETADLRAKLSAARVQWQRKLDLMKEKYQDLFAATLREQEGRGKHHLAVGLEKGAAAGAAAEDVAFWRARVDDAQREAQTLCTQLKRCILQEHRDKSRFAAEKAAMLSAQRRLQHTCMRLRERLADQSFEEDAVTPPVSPVAITIGSPRPRRRDDGDSTPAMSVIIDRAGAVNYGNVTVLDRGSVAAAEGVKRRQVRPEASLRTLRRPEQHFKPHPSLETGSPQAEGKSGSPPAEGKLAKPVLESGQLMAKLGQSRGVHMSLLSPRSMLRASRRPRSGKTKPAQGGPILRRREQAERNPVTIPVRGTTAARRAAREREKAEAAQLSTLTSNGISISIDTSAVTADTSAVTLDTSVVTAPLDMTPGASPEASPGSEALLGAGEGLCLTLDFSATQPVGTAPSAQTASAAPDSPTRPGSAPPLRVSAPLDPE